MNDPDVVFSVCLTGLGAMYIAFLLHFLTWRGEPSGFRLVPATMDGWVAFYLRTVILVCILSMLFARAPHIHPIVGSAWNVSAVLLFVSSSAFWRFDRVLRRIGFVLSFVSLLLVCLLPAVTT